MTDIKILNRAEKAEVESNLRGQFGIGSVPGKIVKRNEERLFLFTGDIDEKRLERLEKITFIERMGVYFAKIEHGFIRLSIEGSQLLGPQADKNIFSLDQNQTEEWMKGRELLIRTGSKGFLIMKHGQDFLGTGKASEAKIGNFIPKTRRLKERQK